MTRGSSRSLSALLSGALVAFTGEFEHAGEGHHQMPSLAVWSNLLRVLAVGGVAERELPRRARVSRRAMQRLSKVAHRSGWISGAETAGSQERMVQLTTDGRSAWQAGRSALQAADCAWQSRLGRGSASALRASLEALVAKLELEFPHYPVRYGQTDDSMSGGRHVPEQARPPRLPAHGAEWPVVLRDRSAPVSTLPLSALLSQALVAFAIDYENAGMGSLATAANALRFIPDAGTALKNAPAAAVITGSGRSRLERHGIVVVERDAGSRTKLVRLTPRGRRMRDGYVPLLAQIEDSWQVRYGRDVVGALRQSLEAVAGSLDERLPEFPAVD